MTMTGSNQTADTRNPEAGFTLVEALSAIVILVFGLIAVTNLLLVAASSNTVANQGTAAVTAAQQRLEALRNYNFPTVPPAAPAPPPLLTPGGSITADAGPTGVACNVAVSPATYNCDDDVPGVGRIHTRWAITAVPGTARALYIQVRSEGRGALAAARSRAEFTTLRTCTDSTLIFGDCPLPPSSGHRELPGKGTR